MTADQIELVLASACPARARLLGRIGYVADRVIAVDIDQTPRRDEPPSRLVARLAMTRARTVHQSVGDDSARCFVLAADTAVISGGRSLGSPTEPVEARAMLRRLSGRAHRVVTAVAAIAPGGRMAHRLARARVRFKRLSEAEIDSHLAGDHWRNAAGGYAIDGSAGRFAIAMSGSYSAIVGLPLYETCCILDGLGYRRPKELI